MRLLHGPRGAVANERQKRLLGERIVARFGGGKAETDDLRKSPALTLIAQLATTGADGRNADEARQAGSRYHGIGRP